MSERLTDEQLRELDDRLRRAGPGEAIRVSSEELNAIRRGDVMFPNLTDAAELLALRARVAQLEAALTIAGAAMVDWLDAGYKLPHLIQRIDAINLVLEDASW